MVSVLTLALAVPTLVSALGQMSQPIVVSNARRGQVIKEKLTLFNSSETPEALELSADGDIETWATFSKTLDFAAVITTLTTPAKSNLEAYVAIKVPDGTPNGEYKGNIVVSKAAESETKTGADATVQQRVSRSVTITVTDQESIAARVQVIPVAFDVKPGDPLAIRLKIFNDGNVQIAPQTLVRVTKLDGSAVNETIFPYPPTEQPVLPLGEHEITVNWPTYGLAEAKYRAAVIVSERGTEVAKDDFAFSVNPKAGSGFGAAAVGGNTPIIAGSIIAAGIIIAIAMRRRK